jgi:hypothetical protein
MSRRVQLVLAVVLIGPAAARADVAGAARAFSDGQAAQLAGDYDHAAQSFELAYTIEPSKEALRSAVRARQQAGQLARAATLAEVLLARYAADAASSGLATAVIAEAQPKLGLLSVSCSVPCTLAIDGRSISLSAAPSHRLFVAPGALPIAVSFEGDRNVRRDTTIKAGETIELQVDPPPAAVPTPLPPPPPPPSVVAHTPRRSGGLSPAVVLVGSIATLGVAGVAVWSGIDTNAAHDDYVANPTHDGWEKGRTKQLRTNILFGTAAGLGVATVVIAIFGTRWHGSSHEGPTVSVVPSTEGVTVSYGRGF